MPQGGPEQTGVAFGGAFTLQGLEDAPHQVHVQRRVQKGTLQVAARIFQAPPVQSQPGSGLGSANGIALAHALQRGVLLLREQRSGGQHQTEDEGEALHGGSQ